MSLDPRIHLAVDLAHLQLFFPYRRRQDEGIDLPLFIEREGFDAMAGLLEEFGIRDNQVVHDFCFILIWIMNETGGGEGHARYQAMWSELESLKQYLVRNRVTSITLRGEPQRNKAGELMEIRDEMNIDRVCDGLRTVFREEFDYDKPQRRTKGQTAWQRRRMARLRDHILNYFTTVPELDELDLQEQNQLIQSLSELAGITL